LSYPAAQGGEGAGRLPSLISPQQRNSSKLVSLHFTGRLAPELVQKSMTEPYTQKPPPSS